MSVFDNEQFCNGFVEFYESAQFEKYMKPFLAELVEMHRDKLESSEKPEKWQHRLQSVRFIMTRAEMLKREKAAKANESTL